MKRLSTLLLVLMLCLLPAAVMAETSSGYEASISTAPDELTNCVSCYWKDGKYLVINQRGAPYIYDTTTGDTTYFTHLPEQEEAWLEMETKSPEYYEELASSEGILHAWFVCSGSGIRTRLPHQKAGDHIMLFFDGGTMLFDMNAGTVRLTDDAEVLLENGSYIVRAYGDEEYTVFSAAGEVVEKVSITDVVQEGVYLNAINVLGDTEAFLLSKFSHTDSSIYLYIAIRKGGVITTVPIGKYEFINTPAYMKINGDGSTVFVYGTHYPSETPVVVHTETGSADVLYWDGENMVAIPLDEDSNPYELAAEGSVTDRGFHYVGESEDGRHALFYAMGTGLMLTDMHDLQTDMLLTPEDLETVNGKSPALSLVSLEWNGGDQTVCYDFLLRITVPGATDETASQENSGEQSDQPAAAVGNTGYSASIESAPSAITRDTAIYWQDGLYLCISKQSAPYLYNINTGEKTLFATLPHEEDAWLDLPTGYSPDFDEIAAEKGVAAAWFACAGLRTIIDDRQVSGGHILLKFEDCAMLFDMEARTIHLAEDAYALLENGNYIQWEEGMSREYSVISAQGELTEVVSLESISRGQYRVVAMDVAMDTEVFLVENYPGNENGPYEMAIVIRDGNQVTEVPFGTYYSDRSEPSRPIKIVLTPDGITALALNSNKAPVYYRKGSECASVLFWNGEELTEAALSKEADPESVADDHDADSYLLYKGASADGNHLLFFAPQVGLIMMDADDLDSNMLFEWDELDTGRNSSPANSLHSLYWNGGDQSYFYGYIMHFLAQ